MSSQIIIGFHSSQAIGRVGSMRGTRSQYERNGVWAPLVSAHEIRRNTLRLLQTVEIFLAIVYAQTRLKYWWRRYRGEIEDYITKTLI